MDSNLGLKIEYHRALIIGSGIAGLSAALGLGHATVLTDKAPGQGGSSNWAQGGIAAALGSKDATARHGADTVAVAGGIADVELVQLVTDHGPAAVAFLEEHGAQFDRQSDGGELQLGREAGHSRARIVHASGDSTGAEIMRALTSAAQRSASIDLIGEVKVLDLAVANGSVVGVVAAHRQGGELGRGGELGQGGELVLHLADAVVLATGGYGHAYARTSTPAQVTGAGIAMAARAGADIADMEFVQFHPTTLDVDSDPAPLLTEALRGEGARLVDRHGRRFMMGRHDDLELAPRDVVARAVYQSLQRGDRPALDARAAVGAAFPARFPTVFALASAHGLDARSDLLPVAPAAHYTMGGVAVDQWGRSSLPGLWAAGEVASSGLHGANRLASNSLLEGVVLGRRVAKDIDNQIGLNRRSVLSPQSIRVSARLGQADEAWIYGSDGVGVVRELLWSRAGVVRDDANLELGINELDAAIIENPGSDAFDTAVTVARLILNAARTRTESRGAHARGDFPAMDPAQATRRLSTVCNLSASITLAELGRRASPTLGR